MQIDITIDFQKDGCSNGSAVSVTEGCLLVSNFTVWREGFSILVDFGDQVNISNPLFPLKKQAEPMIVREYVRLCILDNEEYIRGGSVVNGVEMRTDIASRNLLIICVDGLRDVDMYGRLYILYAERPILFHSTHSLLLLMERFYDEIDFPQSATQHRRFKNKNKSPIKNMEKGMSELPKHKAPWENGEKATFIIKVEYRQNSTWQGTVTWVEAHMVQHFRSALELIRLIDSVGNTETEEKEA